MHIECKRLTDTWKQYTLTNDNHMHVTILNYGGIITDITVPDQNGVYENVVLGYKHIDDYADNPNFFGALIGRVAGRIQNASFPIGNQTIDLDANEGNNHLHGGADGFDHVMWNDESFQNDTGVGVILTHSSHGEASGYPGNVDVSVTYTLTNDNKLIIDYHATTDQTTPFSLTNHSYFNLSGNLKETVHNHDVTLDSSRFLPVDEDLIPTGECKNVTGTPFDFRQGKKISTGIDSTSEQNLRVGNGYDHYFLLDAKREDHIVVKESKSGRVLRIQTNQPGFTMYTANGLANDCLLKERQSDKHLGVCFETHAPSAALNHEGLSDILLTPDETYRKQTVFTFDVQN
ncbi:MAG TPA: aldose epimerase family protein [Virgibacillus sp.]|nr:aldose epimerase family protein [Virgibacillus sp.]